MSQFRTFRRNFAGNRRRIGCRALEHMAERNGFSYFGQDDADLSVFYAESTSGLHTKALSVMDYLSEVAEEYFGVPVAGSSSELSRKLLFDRARHQGI